MAGEKQQEFVYRVSTDEEWDELQRTGATLGRDIDHQTGCIHLSDLHQVKMVLNRFYKGKKDLFLLQVATAENAGVELSQIVILTFAHHPSAVRLICSLPLAPEIPHPFMLGEGLIYEAADGSKFPHFYGPSRSFSPLQLRAVTKAEKLEPINGDFSCTLLNQL